MPNETGASMHFEIRTYFGAYDGEAYNNSSETEAARDLGAVAINTHLAHDISDLVTGLAAGDLLTVRVYYDATVATSNGLIRGLRLKYS